MFPGCCCAGGQGRPVGEGSEVLGNSNKSIPGNRGVRWPLIGTEGCTARSSADIAGNSSSSCVSTPATPPPAAATPRVIRSHPVSAPGARPPAGPAAHALRSRSTGGGAIGTPEIVPEDAAVCHAAGSGATRPGRVNVSEHGSAGAPVQQMPAAASAFATAGGLPLSSAPSGDMGHSNKVAQLGRLESGDGHRETLSMFAWPWVAVSEAARAEGDALKRKSRQVSGVGAGSPEVVKAATAGVAAGAEQGIAAVAESARDPALARADTDPAEQPRRGSWWGPAGKLKAAAAARTAVQATVRFAQGLGKEDSDSEEEGVGLSPSAGASGALTSSVPKGGIAAPAGDVSDMAVLCGWFAPAVCFVLRFHGGQVT